MRLGLGIGALTLAYLLSQFYRAFLAVLAPTLSAEIGATGATLADASGLWFLGFAAMQIPVGWALDRIGPRWTASVLLALGGGGGAAVFATATGPGAILAAMALIGIGCAPVLMSAYFILARSVPAERFGTLAGVVLGVALLGNIASAAPLAWAVEVVGWRGSVWAMAGVTVAGAGLIAVAVRDPDRPAGPARGSVWELVRQPALWPIMAMMAVCYMPVAALRGLWVGPFHAAVYGYDTGEVGRVALVMGLSMVAGTFAMGPLERRLGTRKWLILGTNLGVGIAVLGLWAFGAADARVALALFAAVGLLGSSFPLVIAHGRAFVPAHLTGRGVTLLNMFGIASVGLAQVLTGRLYAAVPPDPPAAPYAAVFLAIGLVTLAGCAAYLPSTDRTD